MDVHLTGASSVPLGPGDEAQLSNCCATIQEWQSRIKLLCCGNNSQPCQKGWEKGNCKYLVKRKRWYREKSMVMRLLNFLLLAQFAEVRTSLWPAWCQFYGWGCADHIYLLFPVYYKSDNLVHFFSGTASTVKTTKFKWNIYLLIL